MGWSRLIGFAILLFAWLVIFLTILPWDNDEVIHNEDTMLQNIGFPESEVD
jgi:hypothetical protein